VIEGGTMPEAQMAAKVAFRLNGLPDASAWWLARASILSRRFADDVAGLAQIQELFEADQLAFRVGPAARGPAGVELAGLGQGQFLSWEPTS